MLFPLFSAEVWVEIQARLSHWFPHQPSLVFLGTMQTCRSPTHPISIGLLFVFYTRENNCMHPIYFLCKLLSVGFQHCLTIAYSKAVWWHCLVAITPKENHINVVFLSLICREWSISASNTETNSATFIMRLGGIT